MFEFKKVIDHKAVLKGRSKRYIANEIGINEATLNLIMSGKQTTQKTTAFCITKMLNENAEIEDYFTRKEK